jgi:hypothetical protein
MMPSVAGNLQWAQSRKLIGTLLKLSTFFKQCKLKNNWAFLCINLDFCTVDIDFYPPFSAGQFKGGLRAAWR